MAGMRGRCRCPPVACGVPGEALLAGTSILTRRAQLPRMSVRELYEGLVALKKIERDPAQQALLSRLDAVEQRVANHRSARRLKPSGWLFGNRDQAEPVKGLYVYGDVGRGKTMMMDLFFEANPVGRKRRAHFHE